MSKRVRSISVIKWVLSTETSEHIRLTLSFAKLFREFEHQRRRYRNVLSLLAGWLLLKVSHSTIFNATSPNKLRVS